MTWALILSAAVAFACIAWFVAWDWSKPGQERKHPLLLVLAVLLILPPDPADARVELEPITLPDVAALVAAVLIEVGLDVGAPVSDPEAPTVAPPEVAPAPPAAATPPKPAGPGPEQVPPILHRIAHCESRGDWTAQNPRSSASGKWQWIDGTWRSLEAATGYRRAKHAPPAVQRAAAIELWEREGTRPWLASRKCWSR